MSAVPATAPGRLALVQRFLNTLHVENGTDALADDSSAREWLTAHAGHPGVFADSATDLSRLRGLRHELRALCGDGEPDPDRFAALADAAPLRAALDGGRVVLRPDGVVATLLAVVLDAQADGTWARLRICRHDGCRWAFYDRSRSRTGTWCAMGICGNRTKVAKYRYRLGSAE